MMKCSIHKVYIKLLGGIILAIASVQLCYQSQNTSQALKAEEYWLKGGKLEKLKDYCGILINYNLVLQAVRWC